jgi:hypothetical protein
MELSFIRKSSGLIERKYYSWLSASGFYLGLTMLLFVFVFPNF